MYQAPTPGVRQHGFGPNTRYFYVALLTPGNIDVQVVDLQNLVGTPARGKRVFHAPLVSGVFSGDPGGFSPDGRTFLLVNGSPVTVTLRNLATEESHTFPIIELHEAKFGFSPCGDVFGVINVDEDPREPTTSQTFVTLYGTFALTRLRPPAVYTEPTEVVGIETTADWHRALIRSSSPDNLLENGAALPCPP